ncbi:hypothetical protein IW261DRAFT_397272 [Armillaria novae-zelandiae]|uniref:Uncharacterized protein n=1 Tax=Armillaria novae-zelandiae TaxID=153914 RepID=A0AA39UH49_9AGAR|nr:hypothetical protein IW261DRAFT_397272 [Armillaria novae-zelandiae]
MMNAPATGPSFVFRSIATVLEERITREREIMDAAPSPPVSEQVDMNAMEAQLRQLVLASRRRKPKSTLTPSFEVTTPPVAPQPLEDVSMEPAIVVTPPSTPSSSKSSEVTPRVSGRALDDLAVTFITGAIKTAQMSRERRIPTSPYRPSSPQAIAAKRELAAKQRRLEQRITESKALIAKLGLARTKQEKDSIMKLLRETSAEDDRNKSPTKSSWLQVESSWDGILIISDDEDDMDLGSDDEGML